MHRTRSLGSLLPVALFSAAALFVLIGGLTTMGQRSDQASVAREMQLVENGLHARVDEVQASVIPQVVWDDAVRNLDNTFSQAWAHDNIGVFLNSVAGFDATFVLDPRNQPVFAALDGKAEVETSFAKFSPTAEHLVETIRSEESNVALAPAAGDTALRRHPQASTMARIGGDNYIVVASLVQPDFGTASIHGERAPIVVAAMKIDPEFLDTFAKRYLLSDFHLTTPGSHAPDASSMRRAAVALKDVSGAAIGWVTWKPDQAGRNLRRGLGIPLILIIAVLSMAAFLFYARNIRANRALALHQQELEASLVALTAARDAANAANISKSQFLASMSHEIRTPLNGILGMAEALAQAPLLPDDQDKLKTIVVSADNLGGILGDLLDLSAIEASQLALAPVDSDLRAVLRQVEDRYKPLAQHKGLQLAVSIDPQIVTPARFDPIRLRQCVSNLVSNAIKFTSSGSVEVSLAAALPLTGTRRRISIAVRDTGIGIPANVLPQLFQPFTQADGSTARAHDGAGLGLAITARLAALMGGGVEVESLPGKGSTFTLTVDVDAASTDAVCTPAGAALPARDRSPGLAGARVLIVDDNATNRKVVKLLLGGLQLKLFEAENGRDALDLLEREPFDIVLLDAHMPVMDGRECIRRIRTSTEAWASIPVIACTAEATPGAREAFLALGMNDYMAKPLDKQTLVATLSRWLVPSCDGPGSTDVPVASATPVAANDQADLSDILAALG